MPDSDTDDDDPATLACRWKTEPPPRSTTRTDTVTSNTEPDTPIHGSTLFLRSNSRRPIDQRLISPTSHLTHSQQPSSKPVHPRPPSQHSRRLNRPPLLASVIKQPPSITSQQDHTSRSALNTPGQDVPNRSSVLVHSSGQARHSGRSGQTRPANPVLQVPERPTGGELSPMGDETQHDYRVITERTDKPGCRDRILTVWATQAGRMTTQSDHPASSEVSGSRGRTRCGWGRPGRRTPAGPFSGTRPSGAGSGATSCGRTPHRPWC